MGSKDLTQAAPTLQQRVKETVLALPSVYNLTMSAVGAHRARVMLMDDYVRAKAGDSVLDIGCGTGEILDHLPQVDYLGIDIEQNYIDFAQTNYAGRGEFLCCRLEDFRSRGAGRKFDIAIAVGLLHHLTDDEAKLALEIARDALKPGGRLVTVDGCFVKTGQNWVSRKLVSMDRGRYIRQYDHYMGIASSVFPKITPHVLHNMLRIPFTHLIMELSP